MSNRAQESGGPAARAGALAFVVAFVALFTQVLVHRLVSAKLLNNFAFFVISLTMLGFAASGALLQRRRDGGGGALPRGLTWCASLFGISLLAATVVLFRSTPIEDVGADTRWGFLLSFTACLPAGLLYALPFGCCGYMLGALLTSPRLPARRLYFLDLAGSALGAVAVVPAISLLGAERATILAAALLLVATFALAPDRARGAWALAGVAVVTLGVAAARPAEVFWMRFPRSSFLGLTQQPQTGYVLERVVWDPIARIEVSRVPPPNTATTAWPSLFGDDGAFLQSHRMLLTQNNNAFTYALAYDGRPGSLRGIRRTVYSAAYHASGAERPRVLVIGVGGGLDLLAALDFDASSVTGVEVNGATLGLLRDTYADYFRPWVGDPRVRLVHDEGRHFLAHRPDTYDVLQLSGVDSVSGTPGAAHVFSENYLYTVEAFELFLSRLSPNGILNVMRPEHRPARDGLRLLATAVEALRRRGVREPSRHVVAIASDSGTFTALLLKATPFTSDEAARAGDWAGPNPYVWLAAAPGRPPDAPNPYDWLLAQADAGRSRAAIAGLPWDVAPVDDDRPFFFRFSRWRDLVPSGGFDPGVPVMELGIVALLVLCSLAALLLVFLPMRAARRAAGASARSSRLTVFFVSIGLGYMAIEIALLQKLGLLLGHPNHALSVVLAALLVSTGLGSLVSARIVAGLRGLRFVSYALCGVVLAESLLVLPRLADWVPWPMAARVALALLIIAPVGVLLGTFFPTALEAVKRSDPGFAAWAWGLNGMASVVGPVLSVALAMTVGAQLLLLAALPVYLVAGWSAPAEG